MADLKAIHRSGQTRNYARWRLIDGSTIETPLTDAEYAALGARGAGEPSRRGVPVGAVWEYAAGGVTAWDTADGRLPFGGYERRGADRVLLGLGELSPVVLRLPTNRIEDLTEADQTVTIKGRAFRLLNGTIEAL